MGISGNKWSQNTGRGFGINGVKTKRPGKVEIKRNSWQWVMQTFWLTHRMLFSFYGRTCDSGLGMISTSAVPHCGRLSTWSALLIYSMRRTGTFSFNAVCQTVKKAQVKQLFVAAIISVCTLRQQCARFIIVLLRRRILSKLPACFISHSQSVIQPFLIIF